MKIQESFLPSFPFFHLLLHWVRQPFLGIPPFISDPGGLCLFLYLDLNSVNPWLSMLNLGALYTLFWRQKLNKVLTKTHDEI